MFARVRRRLTLQYVLLTAAILLAVAAAIAALTAAEVRRVDDLELRLRAERLGRELARTGFVPPDAARPRPSGRDHDDDDHDDDHDRREERERRGERGLAELGLIAYAVATDGSVLALSGESVPGLPDQAAAQASVQAGAGQYQTLETPDGALRLYNLPVQSDGGVPLGVVQVARSAYFAGETVARLLTVVGALGAGGLAAAGAAGYWLAGRAMQPIVEAMQRQRDFVADASHELRTPLALLRANAEVLARHPEQQIADNLDLVDDLIAETGRLGRLVTDLLTLARADAGQLPLAHDPVDLSELGHELVRELHPLAAQRGLGLRAAIAPAVTLRGDADRLRQLGLILLDNALRYTQQGAVTLQVAADAQAATLSVADTGPGIAPEHLPHLFDRFYRTDAARNASDGGAGLGLSIAKWIAEAHGGTITVTSTPGQGSAFTVRLPWRSQLSAMLP